ncbi:serine-threonine/tyrosine-protein kinase catalytic domain-containing protein [Tanacetum coccineum]
MSIMKNWEGLKIPFEKIDVATENFKTCIGRGGYGWVYKGLLSGQEHPNLISLLGYCDDGKEKIIVYEYVAHGNAARGWIAPAIHIGGHRVLCGRLCIIEPDNGFILSGESVKEYYNKGDVIKIIDASLREHMGSYSMTKFSEIAYRCLARLSRVPKSCPGYCRERA